MNTQTSEQNKEQDDIEIDTYTEMTNEGLDYSFCKNFYDCNRNPTWCRTF